MNAPAPLPQGLQAFRGCPPGAEPLAHIGGREGALVLHGFTGSPWEVRPLAEALVRDGLTVAMPMLAGHGSSVFALDETHWRDWLNSARQALAWLDLHCDRVHFSGLSMGSLLCLLLVQERPAERTGSLLLLAPALDLPPWQRLAIHAMASLGWPVVLGKADPRLPEGTRPPGYQAIPLRAAQALLELTEIVRVGVVPAQTPILALHGTEDRTIPHRLAERRARELLGDRHTWQRVPGGGHLLLRDGCGAEVIAAAEQFIRRASQALPSKI